MQTTPVLGIDFGGSGIKGALVDVARGEFTSERHRIATPHESTPAAVAEVVADIANLFVDDLADRPIGIAVPSVVTNGQTRTAVNIHPDWIGASAAELFSDRLGRPVHVINDADAAGIAEARYGAARNQSGTVLVTTLGTGIGSALLHNGTLVPNTELGLIEVGGKIAEKSAAAAVKTRKHLSYPRYAVRLQRYFSAIERVLWPDLIVIGGGISKDADKFLPLLKLRTPVVAAQLRNRAGIIGAAALAAGDGAR